MSAVRGAVRRPHRLGRGRREGQRDAQGLPRQGGRPGALLAGSGRRQGMDARVLQPGYRAPLRPGAGRGRDGTRRRREFKESIPYWGAGVAVDADDQTGYVSAYDPRTGQERWRWTDDQRPACARRCWPRAATSCSGASPAGSSTRGTPRATCCGRFQCGSGHHSSPSTYSVDGRQYIVAPSGWGGWAEGFLPKMLVVPRQRAVRVRATGVGAPAIASSPIRVWS